MNVVVYKSLNGMITPPVSAGYAAAKKAADGLKPTIEKTLGEALDKLLDVEDQVCMAVGLLINPMIGQD
jgi:hypothetical protein